MSNQVLQGPTYEHPSPRTGFWIPVTIGEISAAATAELEIVESLAANGRDFTESYFDPYPPEFQERLADLLREAEACWRDLWIKSLFAAWRPMQEHSEL